MPTRLSRAAFNAHRSDACSKRVRRAAHDSTRCATRRAAAVASARRSGSAQTVTLSVPPIDGVDQVTTSVAAGNVVTEDAPTDVSSCVAVAARRAEALAAYLPVVDCCAWTYSGSGLPRPAAWEH